LLFGFIQSGKAQYTPTNEIISNDMYLLEGSSDTLWIITSKGVNYTASTIDSPIVWSGFKNVNGFNISFANGIALIFLQTNSYPNDIWQYNHPTNQYSTISLDYNMGEFEKVQQVDNPIALLAVDATWFNSAFWIACMDGGLGKSGTTGAIDAIFYPGLDDSVFSFASFLPVNLSIDTANPPSKTKRIIAVASDDSLVWVACDSALWSFNPADTTWLRINDSIINIQEYFDIEIRVKNDTTTIYSFVSVANGVNTDTCIYAYNTIKSQWNKFIDDAEDIISIAVGAKDYVYLLDEQKDDIILYRDSLPDIPLDPHLPYGKKVDYINGTPVDFKSRILNVDPTIHNLDIFDINYSIRGSDTLFHVATNFGLFYSSNEHYDEINAIHFKNASRKVPLTSDLEKTYAVPGIINNEHPEAYFAYNLAKDDDVTIDIFDYNMDHVVKVIDNASRKAGKHRTSGRSTVLMYDRWDGTVNGKPVPPGVYFYRIKTKKGKRSFGKVIVAKN
jgi:hypothetical protein